mmetsp:Transcript_81913/g.144643  ORF Transcript_81913/g.144643 Transcript_81913/m.144643 type:complete len:269 (-) Transcript_81913:480-1286(-)
MVPSSAKVMEQHQKASTLLGAAYLPRSQVALVRTLVREPHEQLLLGLPQPNAGGLGDFLDRRRGQGAAGLLALFFVSPVGRGRGDLLLVKLVPVHALEERVGLDLGARDPQLLILVQAPGDQVLGGGGQPWELGEAQGPVEDGVKDGADVAALEGDGPGEHAEQQDPERPPIHFLAVLLLAQDVGGDVERGADEGVGPVLAVATVPEILGQPKVRQAGVALLTEEDVLRLQVTVDDDILMQILQGHPHLGSIKLGRWLVKAFALHGVQ